MASATDSSKEQVSRKFVTKLGEKELTLELNVELSRLIFELSHPTRVHIRRRIMKTPEEVREITGEAYTAYLPSLLYYINLSFF